MSTIASLFPKMRISVGSLADAAVWDIEVNLATKADVHRVIRLIREVTQAAAERRTPDLLDIATSVATDLMALAGAGTAPQPTLTLLRLIAASVAIDCAAHRKQFRVLRDWIVYTLKGHFVEAQVFELDDIRDPQETVLGSSSATTDFVREPFLIWAWGLFYYARVTGDLKPVAASYLSFVERMCTAKLDELSIETLIYAGTWAADVGDSRGALILQRLAAILDKVPLQRDVSVQLTVALSAGVGQRAGLDTVHIAETGLAKFKDDLNVFDKLQLLSHACAGSPDKIAAHLRDFEDAIRAYSAYINFQEDNASAAFERERSFDIIAPIIGTLATSGRVPDACRLICLWRGGSNPFSIHRVAVLLPTWHKGAAFAVAEGMEFANSQNMSDSILRLTDAGNKFLGTNLVMRDDDRFVAHQASRPGIPDTSPSASDEYEKAVWQHYRFDRIIGLLERSAPEGMLIVPQSRDPIQAVMIKAVGRTLPIIASCASAHPDRRVHRVCIWWASSAYGELERRWVMEVFRRRRVEIVVPTSRSKDEFKALYALQDLDVFWMIGHGRFDHYYPEKMSVDLSDTEELTFPEWLRIDIPAGKVRRLFVANLCDSGTTATLGGTGELGLPRILVKPVQALVAHIWPVSAMHAAIFGVVLAIQVVKDQPYFEAYSEAVKIMISGRETIETQLAGEFGEAHEIVQRLRGAPDIWDKLFIWGSSAFLS